MSKTWPVYIHINMGIMYKIFGQESVFEYFASKFLVLGSGLELGFEVELGCLLLQLGEFVFVL